MQGLDHLPPPILICRPAQTPQPDVSRQCLICGAAVQPPPGWCGQCSPICLLCYLVHYVPPCH